MAENNSHDTGFHPAVSAILVGALIFVVVVALLTLTIVFSPRSN